MFGKMVEIAENVYAYVQGSGEWFVNNAGLIVGDSYAVLVDTLSNEQRAVEMKEKIRKVTEKPVKILINTHGHPDHVWTNHVFDAIAIAHENGRKETLTAFVDIYRTLFPDLDFTGAKITPQDVTFKKELRIYNSREIHLVHPGVAHTTGDCYVYLPQEKVVFCGDLLFAKPCTPLALGGSVVGYTKALDELLNLDAEIYVPGHGGVAGKEEVAAAKEYLEFVYEEAKKRFDKGMDWYEAALDIDLGEYRDWRESERIVGNIARAYAELKGEEMQFSDVVEAGRRMLEYGKETK